MQRTEIEATSRVSRLRFLREGGGEREDKRDLVSLSSMRCTGVFLSISTDLSVISRLIYLIGSIAYIAFLSAYPDK